MSDEILVVEDDDVRLQVPHKAYELLGLAASNERLRYGCVQPLYHPVDYFRAICLSQPLKLVHGLLDRPFGIAHVDANQNRPLGDRRGVKWLEPSHLLISIALEAVNHKL